MRLDELGISGKRKLKKQFILFDTQPTCAVGVPADVYARLFYGDLAGPAREVDTFEYSSERYPMIERFVAAHFEQTGVSLPGVVDEMREKTASLPERWEDLPHG
ncbi:MAG: hypothetical protein M5R36_09160 [Deltaproteobacteria bacterium]|nr:hypothetical protein [Deltaproteobacteria bacterium]